MNPDNIKQSIQALVDGITPLANKLGIAVEKLFGWAMKMNYAYGTVDIFVGIIIFIFGIFLGKSGYKLSKEMIKENDEFYASLFPFIFSLIPIIIGIISMCYGIIRFVAPEFSTIKDIYSMIKN
jgi:hypothetical protein